jgi:Heparan-alpha-glucosaminide N-acetyltransferase, catalytic
MSKSNESDSITTSEPAQPPTTAPRVASMDQFRGYTVFGMFLVNFLGGMEAIHYVFKHNNDHFSYADSIMPSFMFACGFSFRLSLLKRLERGPGAYAHVIRRSLYLILVSLIVYAAGDLDAFKSWGDMTGPNIARASEVQWLPSINATSELPKKGKNLVVVASVDGVLHFRAFDAVGNVVEDFEEKRYSGESRRIEGLRKKLESMSSRQELTNSEQQEILDAILWIVDHNLAKFVASTLKANLWEVLAIIGAAQLLILPVIARSGLVRFITLVAFLAIHVGISYWFNYDFVYGKPNFMDKVFAGITNRAWDGGCFGLFMWAVPMLAGSLVFDLLRSSSSGKSAAILIALGTYVMGLGYAANCLTRAYDVVPGGSSDSDKLAASPVLPDFAKLQGRPLKELLADPPFVMPPGPDVRKINYWMMDKRIVSLSFITFATGFALTLYGFFVIACDVIGVGFGVFRMLGMNPLAAYVIHHAVEGMVHLITPKDSPLWWVLTALVLFYLITLGLVKFFDDRKIYIRL